MKLAVGGQTAGRAGPAATPITTAQTRALCDSSQLHASRRPSSYVSRPRAPRAGAGARLSGNHSPNTHCWRAVRCCVMPTYTLI